MKIKIGSIVETSLIDVLFSPSFVIWFSGCNFRCPWCHSKPLVFGKGEFVEIPQIIRRIKENAYAIEYVQATGGEPTLQSEGLFELFDEVKKLGLKTSLDTNSSNPQVIKRLVDKGLIDHFATDLKTDLKLEKYQKLSGVKDERIIEKINESLNIARRIKFVELRTTFVPSLIEINDIIRGIEKVKEIFDDKQFFYVLQQFVPSETLIDKTFLYEKFIDHKNLVKIAKNIKLKTKIGKVYVRSKKGVEEVI